MIVLRQTLLFFAIVGLIQSPCASISRAEAAPSKMSQEIDDIFELLPAARKGEKLFEMYDRLAPRLSAKYRMELVDYLADKYNQDVPKISVKGREATFEQGPSKAVLKIVQKGEDFTMQLNGRVITEQDAQSVKSLVAKVEKILKETDSKSKAARLWSMAVPSAQAFDFMSGGIGALIGAALTYFTMTSMLGYKKPDPAPTFSCVSYNQCCAVNGSQVVGCCNALQAGSGGIVVYHISDTPTNCSGTFPPTVGAAAAPPGTYSPVFKNSTPTLPASKGVQ